MSQLSGFRVLICGAGIAGPSLAYWLAEYGAEVTVVELASARRTSGFAVDFRGPTQLGVLDKMGILERLRESRTGGGAMVFVDAQDRERFRMPAGFAGGELEVHRDDLSRVLTELSTGRVRYRYGETVTGIQELHDEVTVEFEHASPERFDLVIGADGLHSTIRALVFGEEHRFVRHLGHYIAAWSMPNEQGFSGESRHYNEPGRLTSVAADHRDPEWASTLFAFTAAQLPVHPQNPNSQRALIHRAFTGIPWHTQDLLNGLDRAPELYFDSISRVSVPRLAQGRIALLGDAAWGVTLGGMGVGTGIVAAYVLAGELAAAHGEHQIAFAGYERRIRHLLGRWQRAASPGRFLAPATKTGLRLRDAVLASRLGQRFMLSSAGSFAEDGRIPEYAGSYRHVR